MRCNIHNIEYDPGIFDLQCPRCKGEQERREAAEEAHEESIAEQRRQSAIMERQNELLERMRAEQKEREWEQQATLERIAAAEQERLEEERAQRRAEQLRAMLRAGLPELPEELQEIWRHLNDQNSVVMQREEAFRKESTQRKSGLDRKRSSLKSLLKQGQERVAKEFDSALRTSEEQNQLAVLPHGQCDALPGFAPAAQTYRSLTPSRFLSRVGGPIHAELPASRAQAVLVLEKLEKATGEAKPLAKWGCGTYGALWLAAYVGLGTLFGGILSAIGKNPAPGAMTAMVLSIPVVIIAGFLREQKRKEVDADLARFLTGASTLAAEISGTAVQAGAVASQSQATGALRQARAALEQPLLSDYFEARLSSEPEGPEAQRLRGEIRTEEEQLQSLEKEFGQSKEVRDLIKYRYSVTQREILRVGREVVEGLRVPGRKITTVNCGHCSEHVDTTLSECPYCGAEDYAAKAG
jgi:hypothetical protein